ncbi:MAG: tRNA lysidine(34) synthetase TilS [Pyrinomonadaceae bacterium MAG19_C2-C3]|nr:tRNA lysidine(34) synthetase TilS [Pyrinomonadaceae bacterium MAG19_C2-C3]
MPHIAPRLSHFARRLLDEWKRCALSCEGERCIVAVSGGADSVALWLAFDELLKAKRLEHETIIAHLDHNLRDSSPDDAAWVAAHAANLGYECIVGRAEVRRLAHSQRDNLEQAARVERYRFLAEAARERRARYILLAHTMDDQAETVLLRLMRGSGANGLAAMLPVRAFPEAGDEVNIVRPLLLWARRANTEAYCRDCKIDFRVDATNLDERLSRVRVRRQLLPLMRTFNPAIVETLARTATMLGEDARLLDAQAAAILRTSEEAVGEDAKGSQSAGDEATKALRVTGLGEVPRAMRRRVLRLWIVKSQGHTRRIEAVHLAALETLLEGRRGGRVIELPGGNRVVRRKGILYFLHPSV